ncbi:MAG: hypothetical protein ABIJ09_00715 [Pseudomonadota bacterium]
MRSLVVTSLCMLLVPGLAVAEEEAPSQTLILTPRAGKDARPALEAFTRGLGRAVERESGSAALLDADLAAVTPGDLVARCPARISASCLASAAQKTGAGQTLTGVLERTGDGYLVQLKVVDAESAELFGVRDVRLFPARGDELDMELAGECLGRDALWSASGREGALAEAPCSGRVFVTSHSDRERLAASVGGTAEDLWLTVVPDVDARRAYLEKNGVLAGAFASASAVAIVGAATGILLAVQTGLTNGEAQDLAQANPQAFVVSGSSVTVHNEFDPAVSRYRDLESRGRLESFASLGAGFAAVVAAVTAGALYNLADIPGRYEDYTNVVEATAVE